MKSIRKLSILIPVYNEEKTIEKLVKRVYGVNLGKVKKELIVILDGPKDNTEVILNMIKDKYNLNLISYKKNKGKTWAIRQGIKKATGDVIVIQDGDLEYDPNDFKKMLKEMNKDEVKVVYGSRRLMKDNVQYSGLSFYLGGLSLTVLANLLYGTRITDEPTCYKMFDSKLLKSVNLKTERFEFCPEVTAKVSKLGHKIYEIPISYKPRHVSEGKKIKLKDYFAAVWTLIKYRFVD